MASLFPFLTETQFEHAIRCTTEASGEEESRVREIVISRMADIQRTFREDGIVVVKGVIGKEKVRESVEDIWRYILSLPFVPEVKKRWEKIYEGMKDDPWRDVTKPESAEVKNIYPMTGGFGALTRSPAFHLQTQWDIRQNPYIASIFSGLLNTTELMVSIDRISFKYPGQGENEFEHWDSNPFFWQEEQYEGMQGIVALSETSFWGVPKSSTDAFRKKFIESYPYNPNKNEYRIDKKNDPLGLFGKAVPYHLNPGDLVIWSSRCLHQAKKNTTSKVRYAYFITYFPRGSPQPAVLEGYLKKGIDFVEDRIESFQTGRNPLLFPSGIEIRLYSRMAYMMHPRVLDKFCEMFTQGCDEKEYGPESKKAGQTVKIPVEWNPLEMKIYQPPTLTKLGEYLLGAKEDWH